MDMEPEAVVQGSGPAIGAESFEPFAKGRIAGHQGCDASKALAEHFEQEFGSGFGKRNEAEFVDDQQALFDQLILAA